jgi:hypothetical protein
VRFIESTYPVIVLLGDRPIDAAVIRTMDGHFRRCFDAGKRYALLTATPPNTNYLDAKGRKLVADWANEPHMRELSRKFCIGTATVITSALARGVYTALTWIWTPTSPVKTVSSVAQGIDYCFERLRTERIPFPESEELLRRRIIDTVGPT